MDDNYDWPCWEIMNCDESKSCPAKALPHFPCWEIAREKSDYRHSLGICSDCIVYMIKGESTSLSKKEIQLIMSNKERCVLAD